jgi:hypothetical protein
MTKDFVTVIREENQRLRIERVGFISRIEELQAELAQLKAEHASLRAIIDELPQRIRNAPRTGATSRGPVST